MSKTPLALIVVLIFSFVWPSSSQATTSDVYKNLSTSHHSAALTIAQEVEEDESDTQQTESTGIYSGFHTLQVAAFHSTISSQQVQSLFFAFLFSKIATQAP